ncbi:hypothetical protein [Oceanibaculum indicum]|uniref:Uncharacterized protein n=1 Tax=Oceanibaculum indicum TaxID=526216 RepID=A0A420WA28_9PROT|nr:hypothetical protein [Oceanibaculum indicum]RKQ64144.1 hypothetical protein BCL74_3665 [Oceanibaculum indicum]
MQIRIVQSVLRDARWHPLLDVIVYIVTEAESRLTFEATNIRSLLSSPWLAAASGSRGSLPDLVQASLRAFSRGVPSDAVTIVLDDTAPMSGETSAKNLIRIHPLGCISLISRPFNLIVEDEVTDGGFVLWMARLLGRDEVIRAYVAGRLVFRHAGGKGQIVKSASTLSEGIWPRPGRIILAMQLRSAVLLDSDAKYPGDAPNEAICTKAVPWVGFVHLLAGRTIENYIPIKYFRDRLQADNLGYKADIYFSMTEAQRAHFPLKKGFFNGDQPSRPQTHAEFCADSRRTVEERNHFQPINPTTWAELADGFGERFASVFTSSTYRCNPRDHRGLTTDQRAEISNLMVKLLKFL